MPGASQWRHPRRVASNAVQITVSPPTTALGSSAFDLASNAFALFQQASLSATAAHPTSGVLCDVTEDGASSGHTAIDWAAKGCYDPDTKRVLWASCGAGNNGAGGYVYNTMPLYSEVTNTWSVSRAFRAADETASATPIVHMYDGNALDAVGRRFYRKKLASRTIMVFNLDTNAWLNLLTYTGGEPGSYGGDAGMDWIPTRSRLWIRAIQNGTDAPIVFEVNPASPGGAASTIVSGATIGGETGIPGPCVYNPRSDKAFVGGTNGYIVDCSTLAVTSTAATKPANSSNFKWPHHAHVCRDPVGDGWLYASNDGYMYRLSAAGVWTQRAQLPGALATPNIMPNTPISLVMVPIDEYGVVWLIADNDIGANRAWLYKP